MLIKKASSTIFLSLWYDSTWDWTHVSRAIGEHSNRLANVRLTLVHADQIRPQGEYEEQNKGEISMIPFANDLLEQPLQNEMSEDEIMLDQVG